MDDDKTTPAFTRKRIDLQSDLSLPTDLLNQLRETSRLLTDLHAQQQVPVATSLTNQLDVIKGSVTAMVETATTPELFLRNVSNITSALRSLKTAAALPDASEMKTTYDALAALLSTHLVLPFLMDCRARFAHRALFTLLRTSYNHLASSSDLMGSVKELFRSVFLQNATFLEDKHGAPRLYILEAERNRSPASTTEKQMGKKRVLHFLNSLDCLSSTIMTQVPDVFQEFFVSLLPLLADAMQWAVEEALLTGSQLSAHVHLSSENTAAPSTATTTTSTTSSVTIGEDLDNIRFTVRVVTSFVHKHLTALDHAWKDAGAEKEVLLSVTRLALPMFVMLASSDFPKDVLNATGLLFASILTLRRRLASDIQYFVSLICSEEEQAPAHKFHLVSLRDAGSFLSDVKAFVEMTCGKEEGLSSPLGGQGLMNTLFAKVTLNGRFAICKGLLSHLSSPAHQGVRDDDDDAQQTAIASVGVLLASCAQAGTQQQESSPLYKDIVPFALHCSSSAEDSETRFMAIQTLDAVVRHVSAVLRVVLKAGRKTGAITTRGVPPTFALPSEALFRTLQCVSQIVTDLWDDSTTQMSGTLTDTFDEILKVNELLRQCMEWASEAKHHVALEGLRAFVMDGASMLKNVLLMSPERRGRYHALLALLSTVPLATFLSVLGQVANEKNSVPDAISSSENDAESHVVTFACTLLSGASNHKIGNVCGDTFTKLARCILEGGEGKQQDGKGKKSKPTSPVNTTLLERGLVDPLCRLLTQENKPQCAAASVTPATNLSNMVAHFVSPLIKYQEFFLPKITNTILSLVTAEKERLVYATQAMAEILVRSRNAGVDIQPYLKDAHIFRMVQFALQAAQPEVRSMAVTLTVLGTKKFVPLTGQECATMETYLSLNMHLGGDTTAQKQLTELFRKWTKRVVDSYTESKRTVPRTNAGEATANAFVSPLSTQQITEHAVRLSLLFAEHMGSDAASAGVVRKLSVERRVMASRLYLLFLRAWLPIVDSDDSRKKVLVPSVVPVLFSDLSDGWSFARDGAKSLLRLFVAHCSECVYFDSTEDAVVESMKTAERDALKAHAHRNAVGSAARMCLALLFLSRQRSETVDTFARHLVACIDGHKTKASSDCVHIIVAGTISEKYNFIRENPLHGRLALCAELLAQLLEVRAEDYDRRAKVAVADIQDCLNGMLECCSQVLEACSSLVGSEASADESVDCRGHVYDKEASHSEADMRGVVNNTWLGIRVATGTVPLILSYCDITTFSPEVVRRLCFNLVHALLMTKHNGVMRCAREALNTLTRNLMRCRVTELFRIPTELLSFLLGSEGVASTDVSRMLRRSQGLPHAILAVLEAEDTSAPFVLFPLAMKTLLSIAAAAHERNCVENGSSAELSQRSNALNVLKFIFENKYFSGCFSPYVESAFSLATCGMGHSSWNIRNSSLMLFSSVLQRLVGEHPSTGGVGVNTSLFDVARRTPRAMQFIVAELRRHEEALVVAAATGCKEQESLALFPVLQLLSMLSPDALSESVTAAASTTLPSSEAAVQATASVTENVWRCHASPQLMIRTSSATALTCIVPVADVVPFLLRAIRVISLRQKEDKDYFNKVHGVLMQLGQFHRRYVGAALRQRREHMYSASPATKQSIQTTIVSILAQCAEKLRWCCERCPPITVAALSLVNDLLHCAHHMEENTVATHDCFASLCLFEVQVIRSVVCASVPPLVEKGELMQCSALGVVLLLAQGERKPQSLAPEARNELQALLQHVAREALGLADGQHHFVSRVLECICNLPERDGGSARHDVSGMVDAFLTHYDFDLPSVSLTAVRLTLTELSAEDGATRELGCVSWYELSVHMQFLVQYFSKHEGSGRQMQLRLELAGLLEQNLVRDVESNTFNSTNTTNNKNNNNNNSAITDDDNVASYLSNSEVLGGVLRFYAMHATAMHAKEDAASGDETTARVFSYYAQPELIPLIRDAVVDSLEIMARNRVMQKKDMLPPSLLLILLRLLCDDAAHVREHACVVATACINHHSGAGSGCLDQVSCILGLLLVLRHVKRTDQHAASSLNQLFSAQFLESEKVDANAGAVEEGEENEDEAEVLFEKEADNMFIEEALLVFLRQEIELDTSLSASNSVFPSYARLIANAEALGIVNFFSSPALPK